MNRRQMIVLVAGLALYAALPPFLKTYGVYLMTFLCVYLMSAMGLNLVVGYAGQMSIGQAAFFGIGAYASALTTLGCFSSKCSAMPIISVSTRSKRGPAVKRSAISRRRSPIWL